MRDWHETFKAWAKPPSETEEAKGSNAARMIGDAVRKHQPLASRRFDVYATGSYRNNTNVRQDSDMDVAVVLRDTIFPNYPAGASMATFGLVDASYRFEDFRKDVAWTAAHRFSSSSHGRGGCPGGREREWERELAEPHRPGSKGASHPRRRTGSAG